MLPLEACINRSLYAYYFRVKNINESLVTRDLSIALIFC